MRSSTADTNANANANNTNTRLAPSQLISDDDPSILTEAVTIPTSNVTPERKEEVTNSLQFRWRKSKVTRENDRD